MKSRLGLGTAQLGQTYGVVGPARRPSPETVASILERAARHGVRTLDTAPVYGDSERLIGDFLSSSDASSLDLETPLPSTLTSAAGGNDRVPGNGHLPGNGRVAGNEGRPGTPATFRVVTKVSPGVPVHQSLQESRGRLGGARLHGVLVHDVRSLLGFDGVAVWRELEAARDAGLAERIGASIYTADDIDALLERFMPDIIQLPVSVADQRLLRSGHLDRLAALGVEIHARSVFLQGTLLTDPARIKPSLSDLLTAIRGFRGKLDALGLTPLQAALGFVSSLPGVDVILVGVHTPEQLDEIVEIATTPLDVPVLSELALDDPLLVNPALWPATGSAAAAAVSTSSSSAAVAVVRDDEPSERPASRPPATEATP